MRISDWSSDVCSSDLARKADEGHPDHLEADGISRAGVATGCATGNNTLTGSATPCSLICRTRSPASAPATGTLSDSVLSPRTSHDSAFALDWPWLTEMLATQAGATPLSVRGLSRSEEHTSELQSLMRISY